MIAGDFGPDRPLRLLQWPLVRALLIAAGATLALALILAFPGMPETAPLVSGQVSPKTLLAPDRVTYASLIETTDARATAENDVKPVYDPPNAELAREQVRLATRLFDHIDSVRRDPYTTLDQKFEWVRSIPTVTVSTAALSRTLALDEPTFHRVVSETIYALDVTMRDEIRPTDLAAAYARIPSRVSLALSANEADLISLWAKVFVIPNSAFNAQKTSDQRALARERVGTVYRTVEKGEAVVREGQVVTPLAIEALEALGILRPSRDARMVIGPALLALLLALILTFFLIRMRPLIFGHPRILLLIAFLILFSALGARIAAGDRSLLIYLYPITAAVMLVAVLIDSVVALGVTAVLAVLMGALAHNSMEIATLTLAGGIVAALSLGRIERLPGFLWAGVYVSLTNAAVVAIFRTLAVDVETDPSLWVQPLVAALANGALAGLFAIGSLFVLGKLFGITTSLELEDLARPTHPLLQLLLAQAPGTYHHSLIVSQLAEQAAQRVSADALLVRVGAYYHDVGKTLNPQMFIENQLDGFNIHDTLAPGASAEIVIDHIPRGVTLARQFRLPRRLVDFIPQHHGTTLAAFFHRKALQATGDAGVDEKQFRYPGPKPQTREAGILMLADGVEATTRAERPTTPEAIHAIIGRTVQERLRDGQLDESDLTLRDIQRIKEAFFDVLQGLYHSRIKYPEPPRSPENSAA